MGICVSCRRRELHARDKAGGGRAPKGAAAKLLSRSADPAMANSISNIKMANPIKGIVSKRRKRYIKDGFNLDLAYITDRLIAMGFPAEKLEGVYRNHIDEVFRFLEQMHKDHYKIYNLCSERCYDSSKFHGRVERYAFDDHTPPKVELIQPFCEDVHKWLSADPRNVAAVHCKAGKGRTGTMVCCYLLYSGQMRTADEALKFYGTKRTHDEKGVTIPSQRRYVEYYAALVRNGLQYSATKLHIRELLMSPAPSLNGGQCTLELTVSQATPPLKAPGGCHEVRGAGSCTRVVLQQCTPLSGDVRVDVYNKPKMMMRKEKLFHFWFNTFFVANGVGAVRVQPPSDSMNLETFKLTLNKWQLDDAHKDKQHKLYSPDFKVEVVVQQQPASSRFSAAPRAASPPSSASSGSPPPDEHWDSGETLAYLPLADLPLASRDRDSSPSGDGYRRDSDVLMQSDPAMYTEDGYMLIDRSPRQRKPQARFSDPTHSKLTFPAAGKSDCKPKSGITKDGYMLVDATPRQPNVKFDRLPTTSSEASRRNEEYMEFSAADGYMRALEPGHEYAQKYAFVCAESSADDERACQLLTDLVEAKSDDSSDACDLQSDGRSKNKKHSFFKKDEYKSDKGKIPKVSSDHTISDDAKKKYTFFHKREDESSKPRLTLGDVRASWKEFSGKWSDNRKKKDRDDS